MDRMQKRWIIAGLIFIVILEFIAAKYALDWYMTPAIPNEKGQPHIPLQSIKYTQSQNRISLDAIFDPKGTIHIIWACEGKGLVYQNSSDIGQTWSRPQKLTPAYISVYNQFKIILLGDAIYVFWIYDGGNLFQRFSLDGGNSWSSEVKVLSDKNIGYYTMVADKQVLYLIYGGKVDNEIGTFFQRSSDFGLDWTMPKRISPLIQYRDSESFLSVKIIENYIHIACNIPGTNKAIEKPHIGIQYIRSTDLGESWDKVRNIDITDWVTKQRILDYPVGNYEIEKFDNTIWIGFRNLGFNFIRSTDNGNNWSDPITLWKFPYSRMSLYVIHENLAAIFWNDSRNAYHPWWADIPVLGIILSGDDDPYWRNNDIYFAFLQGDKILKTERLTPYLSYAEIMYNSLACGKIGDNLIVIWSGKTKIEKYAESSPYPFEIFFKVIKVHTNH